MKKNKLIDEYINSLPTWQKAVAEKIREFIHKAEPGINEEIKFTNRPYFTYEGNVCAFLSAKEHLNVFIYDPTVLDPKGLINQGHKNATARSIQIYEDKFPDEQAFIKLIEGVVSHNKKGGWRKLETKRNETNK
jgi:hypothetical protein